MKAEFTTEYLPDLRREILAHGLQRMDGCPRMTVLISEALAQLYDVAPSERPFFKGSFIGTFEELDLYISPRVEAGSTYCYGQTHEMPYAVLIMQPRKLPRLTFPERPRPHYALA